MEDGCEILAFGNLLACRQNILAVSSRGCGLRAESSARFDADQNGDISS